MASRWASSRSTGQAASQIGIIWGVLCANCAGFCAALDQNRTFSRGILRQFGPCRGRLTVLPLSSWTKPPWVGSHSPFWSVNFMKSGLRTSTARRSTAALSIPESCHPEWNTPRGASRCRRCSWSRCTTRSRSDRCTLCNNQCFPCWEPASPMRRRISCRPWPSDRRCTDRFLASVGHKASCQRGLLHSGSGRAISGRAND